MMSFTHQESLAFGKSETGRGVLVFLVDVLLLAALVYLTLALSPWWLQAIFSVATGIMIGILFVVGHDAAHNSLTPSRWLNHLLGQLALLPSLHSFSLWVLVHNQTHHRWTNLSPNDYVWTPLDMQPYRELPAFRRWLYRFYRGPFGPLLYYLIEFWWKRVFFPAKKEVSKYKPAYIIDNIIVVAFATAYVAFLYYGAHWGLFGDEVRPWWNYALFGVVIPFLTWNTLMSFVIYLHHTHPAIRWYNNEETWRENQPQLKSSVHVIFPGPINRIFHWIMEHSAHHVRPSIPLYRLREAQEVLEERAGDQIVVFHWSPKAHLDVVRKCKLYDYAAGRWMDFEGNHTS